MIYNMYPNPISILIFLKETFLDLRFVTIEQVYKVIYILTDLPPTVGFNVGYRLISVLIKKKYN